MDEPTIRDVLDAERATTLARIRAMQADYEAIVAGSADANTDDEHDPEGSTLAYERAQVAALLTGAQSNLEDLDRVSAAFQREPIRHANVVTPRSRPNVWPHYLPGGSASTAPTRQPKEHHCWTALAGDGSNSIKSACSRCRAGTQVIQSRRSSLPHIPQLAPEDPDLSRVASPGPRANP